MQTSTFLFRILTCTLLFSFSSIQAQKVPAVHHNIKARGGTIVAEFDGQTVTAANTTPEYSLQQLRGNPSGSAQGILFDFQMPELSGTLYYGFIPYGDSKHPHPVYFRSPAQILGGKSFVPIATLKGRYDMVGWEKNQKGTFGYRVVNDEGDILYDGMLTFKGNGPFEPDLTLLEGPFINLLTDSGATISFETSENTRAEVVINGQRFMSSQNTTHHEIPVSGLAADTEYEYTVKYGNNSQTYSFRTAPRSGSRSSFTFAYASDSRSGQGGGERNIYGANFYIMKKIMALSMFKDIRFFQFSGDLIDGYKGTMEETLVQYANWKRAIEPFAHYFPVYVSMGNHEALNMFFYGQNNQTAIIDKFPFETESAEAAFAQSFVLPTNGPVSEDGASYDPGKDIDFPSYKENVFHYTYDNVGVIVMNSDYWYAPSPAGIRRVSGGLHGYIMDQQLRWLDETVRMFENDPNIDHVFLTQHTPFFPNGGHVGDDMWYNGNNDFRPYVNGKPLEKGIIERRDQLLDIVVNKSTKVIAILTGDEHNYARTQISPETNIYPENYPAEKIRLTRTIYQINNGAAGAPYYAQEVTPWTPFVSGFTTQNAVVFFHINGKSLEMEVLNPDTLEEVDRLKLR